jgi:hypothetical protein
LLVRSIGLRLLIRLRGEAQRAAAWRDIVSQSGDVAAPAESGFAGGAEPTGESAMITSRRFRLVARLRLIVDPSNSNREFTRKQLSLSPRAYRLSR